MVSMTRWAQNPSFDPGNPNQRTITAFAFPASGNGGPFQNVWFDPIDVDDTVTWLDSANGAMPGSGISGALGDSSRVLTIAGVVAGALLGGLLGWRLGG